MANNQLTDEELQTLIIELQQTAYRLNGTNSAYLMSDAIKPLRELQERRKAAMDSEPVAWLAIYHGEVYDETIGITRSIVEAQADHYGWESALTEIIPLYRHAQQPVVPPMQHWEEFCREHPAPSRQRDQVRNEHAKWSQATFGDVGPVGPLKHLSKEALEAATEPGDLSEWADMQFLLWDAQRRAGITDEQITQAMIEKLEVNKQRSWPEPKDGEPRQHIKERPRKKVDRCHVCTEGARGGCGTCIFNGNFE